MKTLLALMALVGSFSYGAATPTCKVLRQAKARVYINKLSITQQDGVWVTKNQPVCSTTADVNVVDAAPGCTYNQFFTCETELDGKIHSVSASGLIYFYTPAQVTETNPPIKTFGVSYYIDRDNGEAGFAAATSKDLGLKSTGVIIDTSRDKTSAGTAFNDSISINVTYTDENTP